MLDNYYADEYGIVHQKEILPFEKDYGAERNGYGEKSNYLSYLRLGYIISSTGCDHVKSLLDVGFGNGDFLKIAKGFTKYTYGFDLNYKYLPSTAHKGKLDGYYDIITMFDSLEHLNNLNVIFEMKCKYLVLSVPNCKKPFDDEWLKNWKHLRPNEHLHHMNLSSLLNFASKDYKYISHSFVEDNIRVGVEDENILTLCLSSKK